MYRILMVISLLAVFVSAYAKQDQGQAWNHKLELLGYKQDGFKHQNFLPKYIHYDFSTLFTPRSDFIGYIGKNYQRLKIIFTSITKSSDNDKKYLVKGLSIVKGNKCDFSGELEIKQIRESMDMNYGADEMYKNSGFQAEGFLLANYELNENPTQKYSGVFKGVMILNWYVDKYGILKYDDIDSSYSDSFTNNQYVGTWTEYGKKVGKVANWGERRVPFSGDLDIGASEFYANPKYKSRGWEDYIYTDK